MFKNWKIKKNFIKVIKTYPVVLLCFLTIGILAIYSIHTDNYKQVDEIIKINLAVAVFLGAALNLRALNLSFDNFTNKKHYILLGVFFVLSLLYYFTINLDFDWSVIRTVIILFIEGLLFISLPFVKSDERAEHFTNQAAGRLIISGVLYGIAYGGIAGILFALEELFGLKIDYEIYDDTAIILATTFLPMLWLFGLNYKIKPSSSKLYRVLLCFVCIPLLLVYSAVVYGYIIKIIFNGFKMPSSIIGNLVLWYSFVSIVVAYLARPYKENSIARFFYKWYPIISIPPIIIMFIAMFMRISQYSFTLNRYYLLLGGIWLAAMFAYFIYTRFANKKRLNVIITLSIAAFALFSIAEPISAESIAENSQLKRLEKIISPYSDDSNIDVSKMADDDIIQAQDIIEYLNEYHWSLGYSRYDMDKKAIAQNIDFMSYDDVSAVLGVNIHKYSYDETETVYYSFSDYNTNHFDTIYVKDYSYLMDIKGEKFQLNKTYYCDYHNVKVIRVTKEDDTEKYPDIEDYIIKLYADGDLIEELSLVECYGEKLNTQKGDFGNEKSDLIYETESKSVKLILRSVRFSVEDKTIISSFDGYILFK